MPLLRYSLARLGLLVAAVGLGWWAGLRSWLLVVVAVVVAYSVSVITMRRLRDETTVWFQQRAERRSGRPTLDEDARAEDAVVDAVDPAVDPVEGVDGVGAGDVRAVSGGSAPSTHDVTPTAG